MATGFDGTTNRLSIRAFNEDSNNEGGLKVGAIAAIVIPIIVVLAIISLLYRRRRRAQAAKPVIVVTSDQVAPPTTKFQTWNGSQAQQNWQRPEGSGTFQQHPVATGPWSPPVPPQSPPSSGAPYWQNTGGDYATLPGPVWGQSNHYQQPSHDTPIHYYPPPQDPQLRQYPSNLGTQTTPANNITYDQFIEEVERTRPVEAGRREPFEEVGRREPENRNPWTSGTLNQSSGTQPSRTTYIQPYSSATNDGGQSSGGTSGTQDPSPNTQPNNSSAHQRSHPEPITAVEQGQEPTNSPKRSRKADVVLEWSPAPEIAPTNSQAGTSNIHAQSQPADTPELRVLRERVQRLETVLVDRPQGTQADEEPERPPAYESLPMSTPGAEPSNADRRT